MTRFGNRLSKIEQALHDIAGPAPRLFVRWPSGKLDEWGENGGPRTQADLDNADAGTIVLDVVEDYTPPKRDADL